MSKVFNVTITADGGNQYYKNFKNI